MSVQEQLDNLRRMSGKVLGVNQDGSMDFGANRANGNQAPSARTTASELDLSKLIIPFHGGYSYSASATTSPTGNTNTSLGMYSHMTGGSITPQS